MRAPFGPAPLPGMLRLALPLGQVVLFDGRRLVLHGRARDCAQRFIFLDDDGMPREFEDVDLLKLHAIGQLSFLAADKAARGPKPESQPAAPLSLNVSTPAATLVEGAPRVRAYIRAWVEADCPPRTERAISPIIAATARARGEAPPGYRTVLRWIATIIKQGAAAEALGPPVLRRGNITDRMAPAARDLLRKIVEESYLSPTRPPVAKICRQVWWRFDAYNETVPPSERLRAPSRSTVAAEIDKLDRRVWACRSSVGRRAARRSRRVGTLPSVRAIEGARERHPSQIDGFVPIDTLALRFGYPTLTFLVDRASGVMFGITLRPGAAP